VVDEDNNHVTTNTINFLAEGDDYEPNILDVPNNNVATVTGIIQGEIDDINHEDDFIEPINESNETFHNRSNNNHGNIRNNSINNNYNNIDTTNNNNNINSNNNVTTNEYEEALDNEGSHRFFAIFVTLKEQRHYGVFIKYICLDATFLIKKECNVNHSFICSSGNNP
jgi:hypothetical protein